MQSTQEIITREPVFLRNVFAEFLYVLLKSLTGHVTSYHGNTGDSINSGNQRACNLNVKFLRKKFTHVHYQMKLIPLQVQNIGCQDFSFILFYYFTRVLNFSFLYVWTSKNKHTLESYLQLLAKTSKPKP